VDARGSTARPTVEVVVLHEADAEAAETGGANRLLVCAVSDGEYYAPEPAMVSAVRRVSDSALWVSLRLSDGYTTTGGELTRLIGLAGDFLSVGASGVTLGFLTRELELDTEVFAALIDQVPGLAWRLDRCFDHVLDQRLAVRQLRGLPRLVGIYSSGAATGIDSGFDDLLSMASKDRELAAILTACGARAEHAPWLVRAGVRQFQLADDVRASRSWTRARVDAAQVRSWRLLVDDLADQR
jgi:copper homeostasis protein